MDEIYTTNPQQLDVVDTQSPHSGHRLAIESHKLIGLMLRYKFFI